MSQDDFIRQIKGRGATAVTNSHAEKTTYFQFDGKAWRCIDRNRSLMGQELADGYEMAYCIIEYCSQADQVDASLLVEAAARTDLVR